MNNPMTHSLTSPARRPSPDAYVSPILRAFLRGAASTRPLLSDGNRDDPAQPASPSQLA